ncbi:MAG: ABC transporter ATP-binding protein [Acidimicrobiia bacterium]|nr:ABC transporter ATP-binding protein [Acidimicrobiia bacterium]
MRRRRRDVPMRPGSPSRPSRWRHLPGCRARGSRGGRPARRQGGSGPAHRRIVSRARASPPLRNRAAAGWYVDAGRAMPVLHFGASIDDTWHHVSISCRRAQILRSETRASTFTEEPRSVIRATFRVVEPLLARPRSSIARLAALAFLSGIVDSLLVILVVRMALEAADVKVNPVKIPLIGSSLDEGPTVAVTIVLAVAAAVLHLLTTSDAARLTAEVLAAARRKAYRAHVDARWSRQQGERQGSLQETVGLAAPLADGAQSLADLLTSSLMVATILVVALYVSIASVAVIVVFAVILTLLLRPLGRRVRRQSRGSIESSIGLAESLSEVSTVSRELRSFGVFEPVAERLDGLNAESAENFRRSRFLTRYVWLLHSDIVVAFLVIAVSVIYGSRTTQFVGISTVALLVARALNAANQFQQARNRIDEVGPVVTLFDERVAALEAERVRFGDVDLTSFGTLHLENVAHEYVAGARVIDSVSLSIRTGESVGLIGPSGAGKTTLIEIISRLRTPTVGSVIVDGRGIDEFTESSWTRHVAIVPQEPHLIEASVRENIRFHREWIDDDAIVDAAARAHVLAEIERLPDGFDTVLGPRGVGVSVGQKQRLAIARALAGRPSLLVLDEPTSALDPRSERMLRVTLAELRGSMAVIMVTHRMSTVDACDRLVVVDSGRIVAEGPVEQVMGDESLHDLTRATLLDAAGAEVSELGLTGTDRR